MLLPFTVASGGGGQIAPAATNLVVGLLIRSLVPVAGWNARTGAALL